MSERTLVCSFDKGVPPGLREKTLIVTTGRAEAIPRLREHIPPDNRLAAIVLKSALPVDEISFQEDWGYVPVIVTAPAFGSFRKFTRLLNAVRRLPVEIFLPASSADSYRYLPVLSSLRLRCGLTFDEGDIPWERVNDLMHFGVYTILALGPIQPFHFIASHYRPDETIDFSDVYFNNPAKFLHVDREWRVALTDIECERGIFIADGPSSLAAIAENEAYRHRMRSWQDYFLPPSECSSCEGWRICLGKFAASLKTGPACRAFFVDMLEAAEFFQKQTNERQGPQWPY